VGRKTEAKPGAEGNKVCDRQASGSLLHVRPRPGMKADYNDICNQQDSYKSKEPTETEYILDGSSGKPLGKL
ncbi:hypothetical protein E8E15_000023, partial [Penicillium rubens]